ncbi:MAG: hypothetical protein DMG02_03285 [Acidobacteria bacterium]|nr:MAG: hypothetical protein DMG03_12035 [Acidobacteriota bacterium]PYQ91698.1 MAG: hypothetical protein DMG02_03285 [Acidobacteriota bacterium]PYR09592.1 MAG: hypothetical protein DMF99_14960 [Acidobacteriota bacterium]
MRSTARAMTFASATLALLCTASLVRAQSVLQIQPITHVASLATGSIQGMVQDEKGLPVAGAVVSALGATTAVALTDRTGRFELRTLSPGPYLVRAHLTGFVAPRGQIVEVRPSARSSSSISMRRAAVTVGTSSAPILAAGVGATASGSDGDAPPPDAAAASGPASNATDDHSETAWRLRHARRSILKDATIPEELLADDAPPTQSGFGPSNLFGRAVGSPARLATNLFGGTPFSGQVNLLTLGSFDTPQQLFSPDNFSRSVAYLALGAPVGEHADWTVRAALTQGDIASWIVAGEYTTRAPARHRYDLGWSYSMQRYDGGNIAALRSVTDGSRNAGVLYGFDTYSITPMLAVTYGGRYARYDYLDDRGLLSPRISLTLSPAEHFRISTMLSQRAVAPGAEEFNPRIESGVWLPPQRTFSSLVASHPLEAEYTNHVEVEAERDVATATVSIRVFHQHVADQLVTLFGIDVPGAPAAHLGHYFITNAGDVDASGLSAGVRAAIASRVHGSVEYTVTRARWTSGGDAVYAMLLAPSAVNAETNRIHNVATSVETEVPETATHVVFLYRVSNAFAGSERQSLDARFDMQVRQSLPFLDFSSAKWEMLVAVRNFFRDAAPDQSMYDELLVVRPPKRIVGGLSVKF